jgi:hypothetical protein
MRRPVMAVVTMAIPIKRYMYSPGRGKFPCMKFWAWGLPKMAQV